jgi:hypothetical protein
MVKRWAQRVLTACGASPFLLGLGLTAVSQGVIVI